TIQTRTRLISLVMPRIREAIPLGHIRPLPSPGHGFGLDRVLNSSFTTRNGRRVSLVAKKDDFNLIVKAPDLESIADFTLELQDLVNTLKASWANLKSSTVIDPRTVEEVSQNLSELDAVFTNYAKHVSELPDKTLSYPIGMNNLLQLQRV